MNKYLNCFMARAVMEGSDFRELEHHCNEVSDLSKIVKANSPLVGEKPFRVIASSSEGAAYTAGVFSRELETKYEQNNGLDYSSEYDLLFALETMRAILDSYSGESLVFILEYKLYNLIREYYFDKTTNNLFQIIFLG